MLSDRHLHELPSFSASPPRTPALTRPAQSDFPMVMLGGDLGLIGRKLVGFLTGANGDATVSAFNPGLSARDCAERCAHGRFSPFSNIPPNHPCLPVDCPQGPQPDGAFENPAHRRPQ